MFDGYNRELQIDIERQDRPCFDFERHYAAGLVREPLEDGKPSIILPGSVLGTAGVVFATIVIKYFYQQRHWNWQDCYAELGFCLSQEEMFAAVVGTLLFAWGLNMLVLSNDGHSHLYKYSARGLDTILPRVELARLLTVAKKQPVAHVDSEQNENKESAVRQKLSRKEVEGPLPTLMKPHLRAVDLSLLWTLIRLVLNVYSMWSAWTHMEERNHTKPLNFAKYLIVYVEIYFVTCNLVAFFYASCMPSHFHAPVKYISERLTMASTFSCLRILPLVSFGRFKASWDRAIDWRKKAVMIFRFVLFAMFAGMSLIIKAEGLYFLHNMRHDLFHWHHRSHLVRVLAFINNIVGIFDEEYFAIRMMLKGMNEHPKHWLEAYSEHIRQNCLADSSDKAWKEVCSARQNPDRSMITIVDEEISWCALWRAVAYYCTTMTYREVFEIQTMAKNAHKSVGALPNDQALHFLANSTVVFAEDLQESARRQSSFCSWILTTGYIEEVEATL